MPSSARGSFLISLVAFLFALMLALTPPLALLTVPQDPPGSRAIATASALA